MADKKTKVMWYEDIKGIVEASDYEDKEGAIEFISAEIGRLETKAKKAKEKAEKVKAEGDELREMVHQVLNSEYQSIDDIAAQIEGEDITKAKVTARLTQLVKMGLANKEPRKGEDGRKVMHYCIVEEAE